MRSSLMRTRLWPSQHKLIATFLCLTLANCSLFPQAHSVKVPNNLLGQVIEIDGFQLQAYANQAFIQNLGLSAADGNELHIYIEGDGHAWKSLTRPARNPTPRAPIMLKLMSLDTAPSIYVGRPCYYIQNDKCNVLLWTFARYGDVVLQALAHAYQQVGSGYQSLTLIGHSGGGALAMLIAPKLDKTKAVVTLAGNLDSDAWAIHHQFTPLHLSLNPAKQPPLPRTIRQFHYVGSADRNILPKFITAIAEKENAQYHIIEEFDHTCCWMHAWPTILKSLSAGKISSELGGLAPIQPMHEANE